MRKGPVMTAEQVRAHNERHGFSLQQFVAKGQAAQAAVDKILKPRQNKTELAFGLILQSMKNRGEIGDYKPFGIRLEWGTNPTTGKPMVYSPDYTVKAGPFYRLIEVKGPHIWQKDLIRFRGCRAEWGMWFQFELWQKKAGNWTRLE